MPQPAFPRGWKEAWERSVDALKAPNGAGPEARVALELLREYDPTLRVVLDLARDTFVIWRVTELGPCLQCDYPTRQLDARLVEYVWQADTRRQGGLEAMAEKLDATNAAAARERLRIIYGQADPDRWLRAVQKMHSDNGDPDGIRVQVPGGLPSQASREASRLAATIELTDAG